MAIIYSRIIQDFAWDKDGNVGFLFLTLCCCAWRFVLFVWRHFGAGRRARGGGGMRGDFCAFCIFGGVRCMGREEEDRAYAWRTLKRGGAYGESIFHQSGGDVRVAGVAAGAPRLKHETSPHSPLISINKWRDEK